MIKNKRDIISLVKLIFNQKYFWRWVVTSAAALIAMGAGLAAPYLVKLTVDEGISKKNLTLFLLLCFIAATVMIVKYALDVIVSWRRQAMVSMVRFDLNRRIFKNMHAMPLAWFSRNAAGQAVYAIDNDSSMLIGMASSIADSFLLDVLKVLLTVGIILSLNFKIGLTIILFSPLLCLGVARQSKKLNALYVDRALNGEALFNFLEESFWRSYLIKVFNAINHAIRRYTRLLIKDTRLIIESSRQETINTLVPAVLPMVVTGVVYILSGYQVIKGNLSLGALAAIGAYIYQLISASGELLSQWQNLQPGFIAAQRLEPLLRSGQETRSAVENNKTISAATIKIRQLHFAYNGGPSIFSDFNLDIPAGDYTVITGPSACGKTTLLNLMMRLYPVEKGEILIDGNNVNSFSASLFGQEIILCPQEPMLWNASIAENIIYPDSKLDWDKIKRAAQIAGVDEFVANMEKGYNTIIGENASCISQGQKQRISLARALIKQPKLLLLDEAFSGLPEVEEAKIIERIRQQFKAITIVAVTHRLASLPKDKLMIIKL